MIRGHANILDKWRRAACSITESRQAFTEAYLKAGGNPATLNAVLRWKGLIRDMPETVEIKQ